MKVIRSGLSFFILELDFLTLSSLTNNVVFHRPLQLSIMKLFLLYT